MNESVKAGLVAVSVAASGVLLGLAWYLLAPPARLIKVDAERFTFDGFAPEEPVAADGWFALLGFGFGVIAAVLVWVLARRLRGPIQLAGLALGAIAAGYVAFAVGTNIDTGFEQRWEQAAVNAVVEKPPALAATNMRVCLPFLDKCVSMRSGSLLVPALGAVVGYSLLAGWSSWPSLRREEEEAEEAEAARLQAMHAGAPWPSQPGYEGDWSRPDQGYQPPDASNQGYQPPQPGNGPQSEAR